MLTAADQNYVKAIYRLQSHGRPVSTSSLADSLGVTPASVSGMLRKLSRAKMVSHHRYKGVHLTRRGRRAALDVLRRHRLMELFLVEILGFSWDHVHQEAERLEHAVSDEVLARIDELLGFPRFDPHGSPIPSSQGELNDSRGTRLDRMESGQRGTICEVRDDEPLILQHLSKIGLIPRARVLIREVLPFDGSVVVQIAGRKHSVSAKLASALWVETES